MSKIALTPNANGTGTFTLQSPNSNTDRTLTLPDAAGTLATTADIPAAYTNANALSLFNATGSAPVYACRAWVNFNGTGTVAIRASGNVSSITDNGTGDYTVNFTTAMQDANYCWSASGQQPAGSTSTAVIGSSSAAPTASALRLLAVNAGSTADFPHVCVAIFR